MISITILKHSADIAWKDEDVTLDGSLHVHMEDELAENRDARNATEKSLRRFGQMLSRHGFSVEIVGGAV